MEQKNTGDNSVEKYIKHQDINQDYKGNGMKMRTCFLTLKKNWDPRLLKLMILNK